MKLCHRIVCMVEGKVLAVGKPGSRNPEQPRSAGGLPWRLIPLPAAPRSESLIQFDAVVAGYTHLTILNEADA